MTPLWCMPPSDPAEAALAFHYAPDGYEVGGETLFGRAVAGAQFLEAWHTHSTTKQAWCYTDAVEDFWRFQQHLPVGLRDGARWVRPEGATALAAPGALFVGGPNLGGYAWQRRGTGGPPWSVVGITHTVAGSRIYEEVGRLLTGPVEPWDAVVCTSEAVRRVLVRLAGDYGAYLQGRFNLGAAPTLKAHLPVIPLGVALPDLHAARVEELRRKWRAELGIAPEDLCVLTVGRLSAHAKANPVPSWIALEEASRQTGKRVVWLCAGWFATPAQRQAYERGAAVHCPSVRCILVDGRRPDVRAEIWFAGDVFLSLVDNIQESFGLAPVEAGAHALPAVVSDWDGFRETVEQGVSGFRVSTTLSAAGTGADLAVCHMTGSVNYDRYVGGVSLLTAVDIGDAVQVLVALFQRPDLRRQMGVAGRAAAEARFGWPLIIQRYQALLAELAALRNVAECPPARAHPLHCDPTDLFAHFATDTVKPWVRVAACDHAQGRLKAMLGERLVGFAPELLPPATVLGAMLAAAEFGNGSSVADLIAVADTTQECASRGVSWLLKCGVLRRASG